MLKAIVVVIVLAGLMLAVPGVAETPKKPSLATFDPVQVRGDLKVTLIEVSQTTFFTDQHVQPRLRKRLAEGTTRYVVPALEIAFVVERLGRKPVKSHTGHDSGVRVYRDGKMIEEVDGAVPGGVSSYNEYEGSRGRYGARLPDVAKAELAAVRRVMKSGIVVRDGDDIRIEFMAGYGEEKETFSFDHVPIR